MHNHSFISLIQILICLMSCCPVFAQDGRIDIPDTLKNRPQKHAHIEFDEREFDFGSFSNTGADTLKTHTFTFRNTGERSLVILHAVSGCGCTTPIYTKDPVKPGETGNITVSYRGKGQRPGAFRKSVTVYTNDPRSYVRIFIRGNLIE